jgi:hypothetical protein
MASNEENNTTRHMTGDSLTTKHVSESLATQHTSDLLQRTQTTAHIHNRLGGTEQAPTQNQGSRLLPTVTVRPRGAVARPFSLA